MKNTKRMAALAALGLLSMMFTSCKAVIGSGNMTVLYIIVNVLIAVGYIALDMFLDSKLNAVYGKPEKAPDNKSFAMISGVIEIALIVFMFLCRPFVCFNVFVLVVLLILMIADKVKKIAERKAKVADDSATASPQAAAENNAAQSQQDASVNSTSQSQ